MIWTRRGLWPSVAIVATQTLLVASASAQQGTGVLTGKIEDGATRAPVADVVITVTSPSLQGEQVVVTDGSGLYRVPNLPPGTYTIRVEKETYKPYARPNVNLRGDSTIRIDATLLPESLKAEEVVVVAQAPTVDIGSATTGQTINNDFTSRIAVAAVGAKGGGVRSFEAVAELTPGAKNDDFGVSINGSTSPENQYVIDGLSVNNPAFGINGAPLSIEFTREVNVISGGYMPEYGRATGGTLNVTTKQGSNEFHGSFWANSSPGFLEGKRKTLRRIGDSIAAAPSLNHVGDIGFDIGGPIVKDKLWFYAGFMVAQTSLNLDRIINAKQLDPTTGKVIKVDADGNAAAGALYDKETEIQRQRYRVERMDYQAFGKLTYTIDSRNRLTLTGYALPSSAGGDGKFAIDPQTGLSSIARVPGQYTALANKEISSTYNGTLKWTTESDSKKILVDTTVGIHHQQEGTRAADGSKAGDTTGLASESQTIWRRTKPHSLNDFENVPGSVCEQAGTASASVCPVNNFTSGGPGQLSEKTIDRYQAKSVLTYLAEGLGHHVAKAGLDAELMRYTNKRSYAGGRVYRESTSGGTFSDLRQYGYLTGPDEAVVLNSLQWTTKSLTIGGFIQDSWSIMDKVTLNVGVRYDTQQLYDGQGNVAMSLPNQWSPRVGLIYDPTQTGRSKIYANYARYYESVPLNLMDRAGSSEPTITSVRSKAVCDPRIVEQQRSTCIDDANRRVVGGVESPDTKWIITGAGKTPVIKGLSPQSSDELVFGGEYDIVKNGRLGVFYTKRWMNGVIEDVSRDEAQTYFIGNPGKGLLSDFPKPERNYDGFTVFFTKNLADDWLAQLSYTVSYLRGNYAGLYRPETQQLDPNSNSDFDLKSLTVNRSGPLPGDRTHDLKLFGAKDWDIGERMILNTGLSLRANSGAPTNILGSHPIYGLDEIFILPRGAGDRLPWQFRVDPKVAFGFKWSKEQTVVLSIDVINLLNFQAITGIDQRYTSSDVNPIVNGTRGNLPSGITKIDKTPFDAATEVNKNFGNATSYQAPRQIRIGIRTTF